MSQFILSAFADEISPDPLVQLEVLSRSAISYLELRSIYNTNILTLSDFQITEFRKMLNDFGIQVSAIASPIGKIPLDDPFDIHLEKFRRAIELCVFFSVDSIRVFSFYPPRTGGDWLINRGHVLERIGTLIDLATQSGLRLFHENEHNIYGDSPERVADLLNYFPGEALSFAYDAANFVFCGYCPWAGWLKCRSRVRHLHIKDWKVGDTHGVIAGSGDGRWAEVLSDASSFGYQGFATLEPHLLGGGPTGGVTGEELFPLAVSAAKELISVAQSKAY